MPKTDTSFSTYTSMMRLTSAGQPYTKDVYDMFAAVLLQITLADHRVMFRNYPYTFTTDEAAKVMSSLVFIHIHRKPDPTDPSRQIIATRTTTTFSMDYNSAKSLLQQFLSARLIMSATDPTNWVIRDKGLWCPTLKGKYVLEEFTDSTQVDMSQSLIAALNAPYMSPTGNTGNRIITLDRLSDNNDDQITFSRPNMTAAFKAMMVSLPREDFLVDDFGGMEKTTFSICQYTFLGSHCIEWLCERLTVNSREEAEAVASQFVLFGWVARLLDKSDKSQLPTIDDTTTFKTTRNSVYYVTERGCLIIGWKWRLNDKNVGSDTIVIKKNTVTAAKVKKQIVRQGSATILNETIEDNASVQCTSRPLSMSISDNSNWTRLQSILEQPLMRMYFRDFLRSNYCVENINFWVDHHQLIIRNEKPVLEQLADCYLIYETYFATLEVNIDHMLHQEIIQYVASTFVVVSQIPKQAPYFLAHKIAKKKDTLLMPVQNTKQKIVSIRGTTPERCLNKSLTLFGKVNDHVCSIMAGDSVPKFIKTQKYKELVMHQQKHTQDDANDTDSDEDEEYDSEDGLNKRAITTSLSAQRSSMDHQKHKT